MHWRNEGFVVKRRDFLHSAGGGAALAWAGMPGMSRATETGISPVVPLGESNSVEPWMKGFPPPPERIIRFQDGSYALWPQLRWSFCHIEELAPTRTVWRGPGPASQLPEKQRDFSRLAVNTLDGRQLSLEQALGESYTDGVLVMHQGKIVLEQYSGHCEPHTRHIINSATKSYVGTIAQQLVLEGVLDRSQGVAHYLPELTDTAWGDARVCSYCEFSGLCRREMWLHGESGNG